MVSRSARQRGVVDILNVIVDWARQQPAIKAVALVGSHARGDAGDDSDIDLIFLTTNPLAFRADTSWLAAIEWPAIAPRPVRHRDEDYGALWSRRVWLAQDGEVEFGFAPISWAGISPLDPGTRNVMSDGCRILHDPENLLRRLSAAVQAAG